MTMAAWQQQEYQRKVRASSSPKSPTLGTISATELNDVARLMNQIPCKVLGWKTPEEAMAEEMADFNEIVALAI